MHRLIRQLLVLPSLVLIALIRGYQVALSPLQGVLSPLLGCRFDPSCSQYFMDAVRKYGALRGTFKGLGRLARCHPFHRGGYDPP
jgi:hypothetical protein